MQILLTETDINKLREETAWKSAHLPPWTAAATKMSSRRNHPAMAIVWLAAWPWTTLRVGSSPEPGLMIGRTPKESHDKPLLRNIEQKVLKSVLLKVLSPG